MEKRSRLRSPWHCELGLPDGWKRGPNPGCVAPSVAAQAVSSILCPTFRYEGEVKPPMISPEVRAQIRRLGGSEQETADRRRKL